MKRLELGKTYYCTFKDDYFIVTRIDEENESIHVRYSRREHTFFYEENGDVAFPLGASNDDFNNGLIL